MTVMRMGKGRYCGSITIIAISSFVLLITVFMMLGGFGLVLRIGLPIGLKLLPVNEQLMAWINIPLSITIKAKITEVMALSAENGSVGGGALAIELEMSKWEEIEPEEGEEPLKLSEFIHIQETAEIDQIQYYKAILSQTAVNHWNFFSWILVLAGVFVIGGGTAWRVIVVKSQAGIGKSMDEK